MATHVGHILPFPLYGYRFTLGLVFLDADGDPIDPTNPDSERSLDGVAFDNCTNEVTTVSTGFGYLGLTETEMLASLLLVAVKSDTAKTTPVVLYPRKLPQVTSGTAAAGAAGSITLAAAASAVTNIYVGQIVGITANTGSGQARVITAYNATTKVATVSPNWETNPDVTSTYEILATPENPLLSNVLGAVAGTVGSVTGAVGSVAGAVATVTALGAQAKLDVNAECDTALTDYDAAKPGEQMDIINIPNATAVTAIQSGLATSANQTTLINRIGAFTGTGVNTVLGFLKAALSKTATLPTDVGGTFDPAVDSTEAIRDLLPASPAATGGQMDLVNAPNATAITAIQSGLATSANQTTIINRIGAFTGTTVNTILGFLQALMNKAASTPSDIGGNFSPATDSVEALRDTEPMGTAMRGTDLAALASVWTSTKAGYLTEAVGTAANQTTILARLGTVTGTGVNTVLGFFKALLSKTATVPTDIGGTFDPAADSTEAIRDRGDAAWGAGAVPTVEDIDAELTAQHGDGSWQSAAGGTGANVVTLTLHDADAAAVPNIACVVRNTAEDAILAQATTDENGQVELQLDDGSYKVRYGPSGFYIFSNPYDLTVSGATAGTFTCEAVALPTPAAPDLCVCYVDVRYVDGGSLVKAKEASLTIESVVSPEWSGGETDAVLARTGTTYESDGSGRIQFNAVRGATLQIRLVRPGRADAGVEFEVPDAGLYYIPIDQ
jgi:hypothetical protein